MNGGFPLGLKGQGPLGRTTTDKNKNTVKRYGKKCKRRENLISTSALECRLILCHRHR